MTVFELLNNLHRTSLKRNQSWGPVYKIISDLRGDLARKQQIITCLGYRHVLEMLPDRLELQKLYTQNWSSNATTNWKRAWQFIIERELVVLLYEHLRSLIATGPARGVTIHAAIGRPVTANEGLRALISYDFQEWAKKKDEKKRMIDHAADIIAIYGKLELSGLPEPLGGITHINPRPIAAAARAAAPVTPTGIAGATCNACTANPPRAIGSTAAAETMFTLLFEVLKLKYDTWNAYDRGAGLYAELSGSIHKYNKQFEVEETNWARTDFLILDWLKPATDGDGKVDWTEAKSTRNLPC